MNDSHSRKTLALGALVGLVLGAPSALAADPLSPPPDAAAPTPAPAAAPTTAAAPAPIDTMSPPAAGDASHAAKPAPDSDESPAVPAPDASPKAMLEAHPVAPARSTPQPEPDQALPDDGLMGTHQEHWLLTVGLRESYIGNDGYDLFSENNVLPQLSVAAGRTLFASGPLAFAVLVGWDWGGVDATARGAETGLSVHRFTLGAEGRYHILRRLYAFGRVAPGALNAATTFRDRVVGDDRELSSWGVAADFSAGAAFEFVGDARGKSQRPRGWVLADGGYGWAQSTKLDYKPKDINSPVRLQPLSLGELGVRGGFFRLSVAMTY